MSIKGHREAILPDIVSYIAKRDNKSACKPKHFYHLHDRKQAYGCILQAGIRLVGKTNPRLVVLFFLTTRQNGDFVRVYHFLNEEHGLEDIKRRRLPNVKCYA